MSGITTASAAALLPVLPAAFVIAPTSDHKKLKKTTTYFSHFDHFGLFDEPIYADSVTGTCSNEVLYDIIPPGSISSLKQFLHNIFSVYYTSHNKFALEKSGISCFFHNALKV